MIYRSLYAAILGLTVLFYLSSSGANEPQSTRWQIKSQAFGPEQFGDGSIVELIALLRPEKDKAHPGKVTYEPFTRIKLTPGSQYGWVALVNTDKSEIPVEVSFTLPSAPKQWGGVDPRDVSNDGRTATVREMYPVTRFSDSSKMISADWTVAEGDPEGFGEMTVKVEGRLVAIFVIEFYR